MEQLLFLVITSESKEPATGISCSENTLINSNQAINSIDIRGHNDQDISLRSMKSGTEMEKNVFGRNRNDDIGVKPSRTVVIIRP